MSILHILIEILWEMKVMGKLVFEDGAFFEIDEECVKYSKPPAECKVYEHLRPPTIDLESMSVEEQMKFIREKAKQMREREDQ